MLKTSIRNAQSWRNSRFDAEVEAAADSELKLSIGQSFSGNERNKLFYSLQAKQFADLSAVSGLDNTADGRVLALWDLDRDGWQDMAVVNSNAPLLNIYRNEIGAVAGSVDKTSRMIGLRFVGGSVVAKPNKQFGCRDGYGTKVRVTAGPYSLIREHRCGEGMAGQNSSTMFVGIGDNEIAQTIDIQWLSGIKQQIRDVPAGTLITVYEDPQAAPDKSGVTREPYLVPTSMQWQRRDPGDYTAVPRVFKFDTADGTSSLDTTTSEIRLYTTMATWCAACRSHLPQLQQLRAKFGPELLEMYGIPTDVTDDATKLSDYAERYRPAYTLLKDLTVAQRKEVEELVADVLKTDALPSTIVTDADGRVLLVTAGLPTVSELRKILQNQ